MSAPTPAEVDAKAKKYLALKDALDRATEDAKMRTIPLVELKEKLVELVSNFGSAHKEKSRLLHGITFEMMATFGAQSRSMRPRSNDFVSRYLNPINHDC